MYATVIANIHVLTNEFILIMHFESETNHDSIIHIELEEPSLENPSSEISVDSSQQVDDVSFLRAHAIQFHAVEYPSVLSYNIRQSNINRIGYVNNALFEPGK